MNIFNTIFVITVAAAIGVFVTLLPFGSGNLLVALLLGWTWGHISNRLGFPIFKDPQ